VRADDGLFYNKVLKMAKKRFTLHWTCQPKLALPEVQSGSEEISASDLVEACAQAKRLVARRLGTAYDQVEITAASFIQEPTS
jgi:hypothetical protein